MAGVTLFVLGLLYLKLARFLKKKRGEAPLWTELERPLTDPSHRWWRTPNVFDPNVINNQTLTSEEFFGLLPKGPYSLTMPDLHSPSLQLTERALLAHIHTKVPAVVKSIGFQGFPAFLHSYLMVWFNFPGTIEANLSFRYGPGLFFELWHTVAKLEDVFRPLVSYQSRFPIQTNMARQTVMPVASNMYSLLETAMLHYKEYRNIFTSAHPQVCHDQMRKMKFTLVTLTEHYDCPQHPSLEDDMQEFNRQRTVVSLLLRAYFDVVGGFSDAFCLETPWPISCTCPYFGHDSWRPPMRYPNFVLDPDYDGPDYHKNCGYPGDDEVDLPQDLDSDESDFGSDLEDSD